MQTPILATLRDNFLWPSGQGAGLEGWIQGFLGACRSRNLARGTLEFYAKKLWKFTRYCESRGITDVPQIRPETLRGFLVFLSEAGHNAAGVHAFFRAVRTFLRWFEQETEPEGWSNPIRKVRAPIVPLEPLDPVSIETIRALLDLCDRGTLIGARDAAVLLALLDTGARLAELLSMNREDVDLISGAIQIRSGKGRKPRIVYLGERSRKTLRQYLRKRADLSPALWISRTGERLAENGLRMMLRRRAATAGLPASSPHAFRRAFALERMRAGLDILTLSRLMGHSSLQVLNRYVKQAGEDLERAARASSPVDRHF